jgi:membrane fusion protein (multidrug efflux system)
MKMFQEFFRQNNLGCCLCAVAVLLLGCRQNESAARPQKKSEPPVNVRLIQPTRGEITRTISLPGNVLANQQAALYAKVTGYLKSIAVDKGAEVKQGDLLAVIEVPELLADFSRNKAEVEIAELDFKRVTEAQEKAPDLITRQSIDAARAKFLGAKAGLERAETLLGFCRITAPFAGVVTKRSVDPGAFIPAATSASANQGAPLMTIMDFTVVRVQVAVPEPEVPLIQTGQPVKVAVDELPGKVFEGTVTRSAQALEDASKTMLIEIDLPNPKHELRPGMFATARIGVEKKSNALLLPVEAVLVEKGGNSVFTVADGKAKKVSVKTGFNDGKSFEITDGLPADGRVIVLGKMTLANGQPVSVEEGR